MKEHLINLEDYSEGLLCELARQTSDSKLLEKLSEVAIDKKYRSLMANLVTNTAIEEATQKNALASCMKEATYAGLSENQITTSEVLKQLLQKILSEQSNVYLYAATIKRIICHPNVTEEILKIISKISEEYFIEVAKSGKVEVEIHFKEEAK